MPCVDAAFSAAFYLVPIESKELPMNAGNIDNIHRRYLLRFRSLFNEGRGYAFPCDAHGRVDMDTLSPHALNNYFYARSVIGREVFMPAIEATLH
jgi:hypothetical protein